MSSDRQQSVYGLVFGLASVIVALLAFLIAVLQLIIEHASSLRPTANDSLAAHPTLTGTVAQSTEVQ